MKKMIYGFILGVAATVAFFLLGGREIFIKSLDKKTLEVEKEVQKSGEAVKETVEHKVEQIKK